MSCGKTTHCEKTRPFLPKSSLFLRPRCDLQRCGIVTAETPRVDHCKPSKLIKIWTGIVEWKRHNKTDLSLLSFEVMAAYSSLSDLKGETWPQSLQLHLIPKVTIAPLGNDISIRGLLLFKIKPCSELCELTHALQNGMIGSIKFAPSPGCDIKVIMLVYDERSKKYNGVIPSHQDEFIGQLHDVVRKKIEQLTKSPVTPKSSNSAWKGVVQWKRHERAPGENMSPLPCIILAPKIAQAELKMETWPKLIKLHLLPKKAFESIVGKWFFEDKQFVMFKIKPSIERAELTTALKGDMVGCLRFDPTPGCHIKIVVLMYAPSKNRFLGIITKEQNQFVNKLNDLIKTALNQFKKK